MAAQSDDDDINRDQGNYFDLPSQDVSTECFAGIDFGTSLMKMVYIDKNEQKKRKEGSKTIKIRVQSFKVYEVDKTLEFLKSHRPETTEPQTEGQKPLIMATGLHSGTLRDQIIERVGVRMQMMMETECFAIALQKLVTTSPKHKLVKEISQDVEKEVEKVYDHFFHLSEVVGVGDYVNIHIPLNQSSKDFWKRKPISPDITTKPWAEVDLDLFPIGLLMMGSTGGMMLVNKDGDLTFNGMCYSAGRTFLGLGSILTGGKSYKDIMALAKKGDNKKIDLLIGDGAEGQKDEKYIALLSTTANWTRAFFGKAMETKLEDWDVSDVSRTFVGLMAENMAQFALSRAIMGGAKRVLFAGSTPNDQLVQDEITKYFEIHKYTTPEENIHHEFLRNGGFYGALGSMICSSKTKRKEK